MLKGTQARPSTLARMRASRAARREMRGKAPLNTFDGRLRRLSPARQETLFLLTQGLSDTEIAAKMSVDLNTIKKQLVACRDLLCFDSNRLELALAIREAIA